MSDDTTLRARLLEFFRAHPHEELSLADMAAKFDRSAGTVENALHRLRQEGFAVERVTVYRIRVEGAQA